MIPARKQPARHLPGWATVVVVWMVGWAGGSGGATTVRGEDVATTRARALVSRMTPAEKLDYLGGVDSMYLRAVPRLGIPAVRMADGPVGVREPGPSTRFPAGVALAATWDPDLARAEGAALGRECRARGVGILLAPGINLHRLPVNGRNFEYVSGEDPLLASRLVVPLVQGIQSEGVVATVKHFAGNNQEWKRTSIDVQVGERALRELYLPAFEAAVREGGAGAVMDAYNRLNGVFCTESTFLNQRLLREEWGFPGIVMSDWGATHSTLGAFRGGLDLEMPAGTHFSAATLAPLLRDGEVDPADVDAKVTRILTTLARFGLLDRPAPGPAASTDRDFANEEVARNVAAAGCVLLKNEGDLLPLRKERLRRVAVVGAAAHPGVPGGGGSSRVRPTHTVSVWEGLRDALGPGVQVDLLPVPVVSYARTHFSHDDGHGDQADGLLAEYFANDRLEGPPAKTGVDETVDFAWPSPGLLAGMVNDGRFSVRWRGEINLENDGEVLLQARSDGGLRVYLDGRLALDDWQDHAARTAHATVTLRNGRHDLQVEYRNRGGGAVARFGYAPVVLPESVRESDVVVACVGFDEGSEGEGFDREFTLPDGQDAFMTALTRLHPRTVAVLFGGGGMDVGAWFPATPALVHAWYPGQEGGTALAALLVGDADFSGKLPVTFDGRLEDNPAFSHYPTGDGGASVEYAEGVFMGYRGVDRRSAAPLFPFGFGLSYTRFRYDDLRIEPTRTGRAWRVRFELTNVGDRAGAEVTELYVAPPPSPVARPAQELKGFAKTALGPGERCTVELVVNADALRYFDVAAGRWRLVPGTYEVRVGGSSVDLPLRAAVTASTGEEDGHVDGK